MCGDCARPCPWKEAASVVQEAGSSAYLPRIRLHGRGRALGETTLRCLHPRLGVSWNPPSALPLIPCCSARTVFLMTTSIKPCAVSPRPLRLHDELGRGVISFVQASSRASACQTGPRLMTMRVSA
jgi:hypothetical protein